jgi:voltage-gated potassium channel
MKDDNFKKRVYKTIYEGPNETIESKIFDSLLIGLIILSVIMLILESFEQIYYRYFFYFKTSEFFISIIFTIEYILRLWTADFIFTNLGKIASRIKFILTPITVIDLLAIIPFYLQLFYPIDLGYLRVLRLIRVIRIFKLERYTNTVTLFSKVFKNKRDELLITLSVALILILISSILIYYLEHNVQPEAFPNVISAFWWAVVTLTTVGYGDIYPITAGGRILGGFIALLGIGLVALPTGIIGSGFMHELSNSKSEEYCPYCGKKIRDK